MLAFVLIPGRKKREVMSYAEFNAAHADNPGDIYMDGQYNS